MTKITTKFLIFIFCICIMFSLFSCTKIKNSDDGYIYSSHSGDGLTSVPGGFNPDDRSDTDALEGFPGAIIHHEYEELTENQKIIYDSIKTAAFNLDEFTEDLGNNCEMTDIDVAFRSFFNDYPACFWVEKSFTLKTSAMDSKIALQYSVTGTDELDWQKQALLDRLNEANELINAEMTDFEKELILHNWLLSNIKYDSAAAEDSDGKFPHAYTAYGAIVLNSAVCEGYSRAMQMLLHMAEVDNYLIYGEVDVGSHMWNIVEIDEKKYHLDATWNDPQTANGEKKISHTFFNVTDEFISKTHFKFTEPGCVDTDANYFVQKELFFDDYGEGTREQLTAALTDAIAIKEPYFEFAFADNDIYNEAYTELFDNDDMFKLVNDAVKDLETDLIKNKLTYSKHDEDTNTINITFSYGELPAG